jgi:hypothetical protein
MDKVRSIDVILGVPFAGVFLYSGVYTVHVGLLFVNGIEKQVLYLVVTCCYKYNNRTLTDNSLVQVSRPV